MSNNSLKEAWFVDQDELVAALHAGMGTVMAHKAFGGRSSVAVQAVQNEAERLERLFSRFLPQSDIGRINRAAGIKCEKISPETYEVLWRAKEYFVNSQGLFDITVGALADLWDYKNATAPPENEKIGRVLPLVNCNDLKLAVVSQTAGLARYGQSIDLGGIGKGFASDRFMKIFGERRIRPL